MSRRCAYIAIEKLKSRVIGVTSLTCNFLFVSNRITNPSTSSTDHKFTNIFPPRFILFFLLLLHENTFPTRLHRVSYEFLTRSNCHRVLTRSIIIRYSFSMCMYIISREKGRKNINFDSKIIARKQDIYYLLEKTSIYREKYVYNIARKRKRKEKYKFRFKNNSQKIRYILFTRYDRNIIEKSIFEPISGECTSLLEIKITRSLVSSSLYFNYTSGDSIKKKKREREREISFTPISTFGRNKQLRGNRV